MEEDRPALGLHVPKRAQHAGPVRHAHPDVPDGIHIERDKGDHEGHVMGREHVRVVADTLRIGQRVDVLDPEIGDVWLGLGLAQHVVQQVGERQVAPVHLLHIIEWRAGHVPEPAASHDVGNLPGRPGQPREDTGPWSNRGENGVSASRDGLSPILEAGEPRGGVLGHLLNRQGQQSVQLVEVLPDPHDGAVVCRGVQQELRGCRPEHVGLVDDDVVGPELSGLVLAGGLDVPHHMEVPEQIGQEH